MPSTLTLLRSVVQLGRLPKAARLLAIPLGLFLFIQGDLGSNVHDWSPTRFVFLIGASDKHTRDTNVTRRHLIQRTAQLAEMKERMCECS